MNTKQLVHDILSSIETAGASLSKKERKALAIFLKTDSAKKTKPLKKLKAFKAFKGLRREQRHLLRVNLSEVTDSLTSEGLKGDRVQAAIRATIGEALLSQEPSTSDLSKKERNLLIKFLDNNSDKAFQKLLKFSKFLNITYSMSGKLAGNLRVALKQGVSSTLVASDLKRTKAEKQVQKAIEATQIGIKLGVAAKAKARAKGKSKSKEVVLEGKKKIHNKCKSFLAGLSSRYKSRAKKLFKKHADDILNSRGIIFESSYAGDLELDADNSWFDDYTEEELDNLPESDFECHVEMHLLEYASASDVAKGGKDNWNMMSGGGIVVHEYTSGALDPEDILDADDEPGLTLIWGDTRITYGDTLV